MHLLRFLGIEYRDNAHPGTVVGVRENRRAGVVPPPRRDDLATADAVSLSSVYRAVSILATATSQLPLYVERNGVRLPASETPAIVKTPFLDMSRGDFIETVVTSMAITGNAYWLAEGELRGAPAQLRPLDPRDVACVYDPKKKRYVYHYDGKEYTSDRIGHCRLLTLPGEHIGLSPIQAARKDISGALATRDFAATYFDGSGQPTGILTTDSDLTKDQAVQIMRAYNNLDEDGNRIENPDNPSGIKILSRGMKYQPLILNASDAQWIEARQFDTTTIARLFGVPSSLMLAAVEGTSMTYSNIEQEWISFARFTLSQYTRKIEDELTRMTVRGQRVKFNFDGMLRADTLTRYQAYAIALDKGFMTVDEIRALEDLPA